MLKKLKGKVGQNLYTAIANMDIKVSKGVSEQLLNMSDKELQEYNKAYEEKLKTSKTLSENLYKADFTKLNKEYNKAVDNALKDVNKKVQKLGIDSIKGFIAGMKSQTSNLSKEIKSISNSIIKQFKKALKIKSPSKLFADEIGKQSIFGISYGMQENISSVYRDIKALSNNLVANAGGIYSGLQGSTNTNNSVVENNSNNNATYNFYQTNNSPKALSRYDIYRDTQKQISLMRQVLKNA